jgi:putative transposase
LQAAIPATNSLPVQLFAQDESRLGLLTIRRRRITARGVKPVCPSQHGFANFWLYGCVAPATGERFFMLLPSLNADQMQYFVDEFARAHPTTFNLLLLDNSGAHTAKRLVMPANVSLVFQPPASPELNPAERVWQDLKGQLAWMTFADLAALEAEVVERVNAYDSATIQSLTGYPYLIDALQHVVCS